MKKLLILIILILLLYFGFQIWYINTIKAPDKTNKNQVFFVIKKNEGIRDIGYNLQQKNIIKSSIAFFIYIKLNNLDGKIEAGDFRLSPSQTLEENIKTLEHGTVDVWITIPEGLRAEEIADKLKIIPTYSFIWNKILDVNEGYLFPDTYLFPKDATIKQIISIMRNNFNNKYALAEANQTINLPENQAVIIASIVQREAITQGDMRKVASVLENRLKINMPFQSDVTVEYALGYNSEIKSWWKPNLTNTDLKIDSPYNTYLNIGLPPTPISNPGLMALEAVLNPVKTNYLYYLSDSNGKLHFATTLNEHNANVAKYLTK